MRIVLFQGGSRSDETCPGVNSKTSKLAKYIIDSVDEVEVDLIDFSVLGAGRNLVQPCKSCVSTAGGFHCHWPCSCYGNESADAGIPDLMHDQNVYDKLSNADGLLVLSPVHWYSVSTQLKAAFDRLVCANLTITRDEAIDLFGEINIKNPESTQPVQKSGHKDHMLKNHLEGLVAAFFIHGDGGADDYENNPYPKSYDKTYDSRASKFDIVLMPLVAQLRFSGIIVPDSLIVGKNYNIGRTYAAASSSIEREFLEDGLSVFNNLVQEIKESNNGRRYS